MSEPPQTADPLVGTILDDRYRIDRFVARGGMGRVYRATQLGLGRPVAIKILDVDAPGRDATVFRRRFFMEAAATAQLTHPNTVRVYDYGTTPDGAPYLAMEFLEGRTLEDALDAGTPSALDVLDIVRQACESLAEAHAHGFVHRDIKPSNLFLVPRADGHEQVKVVDFGLVKHTEADLRITRSGALLGSPLYMAPEQITGSDVDERADIYALGALLYHGLVGRPPFDRPALGAVLLAHVNDPVPSILQAAPERGLPRSLDWLVATCMAKDPEGRFASVEELARAIALCEAELRGQTGPLLLQVDHGRLVPPPGIEVSLSSRGPRVVAAPPEPLAAPPASRRVRAVLVILASLALLSVGGLAGALWWRDLEPTPPPASEPAPARPVEVRVAPMTATIERDGAFVGQGAASVRIPEGGRVTIDVSSPGYVSQRLVLDGTVPVVQLELVPAVPPGSREATPASAPAPTAVPSTRSPPMRRPARPAPGPKVRPARP